MGSYGTYNIGYYYLLTVIDTFSTKDWAVAVKNKGARTVTVHDTSKWKSKNLQIDNGREFLNCHFKHLIQSDKINHSSSKASIVERFNRTLKGMMSLTF